MCADKQTSKKIQTQSKRKHPEPRTSTSKSKVTGDRRANWKTKRKWMMHCPNSWESNNYPSAALYIHPNYQQLLNAKAPIPYISVYHSLIGTRLQSNTPNTDIRTQRSVCLTHVHAKANEQSYEGSSAFHFKSMPLVSDSLANGNNFPPRALNQSGL